jgi:hypothetical protein
MRILALALLALTLVLGCDGDPDGSEYFEAGECDPPDDGTELAAATAVSLDNLLCNPDLADLSVIDSAAQWDALFASSSCSAPVPAGIDFATQRVAIAQIHCAPTSHRFTYERANEIVLGVFSSVSGACIGNPVVVAIPRDTKPVRLAHCYQSCRGECPPVP